MGLNIKLKVLVKEDLMLMYLEQIGLDDISKGLYDQIMRIKKDYQITRKYILQKMDWGIRINLKIIQFMMM